MTQRSLSCAELDARLPDFLEGTSTPAERRLIELHLTSCTRCAALVDDLREISHSASALPSLTPSRDLWPNIAERIEAPVIPLAAPAVRQGAWSRSARLAAVAAGLVAVTAGITYQLTVHRIATGAGSQITTRVPSPTGSVRRAGSAADTTRTVAQNDSAAAGQSGTPNASMRAASRSASSTTYDAEIRKLRDVLTERRTELDPRTAAILDNSLRVIDEAIAQSRDALEQDPASRFLTEQLNNALEKKVSLLRTAALLPSRS